MLGLSIAMDLVKFCKDELLDHLVYSRLALQEKDENRKETLQKLSDQEYDHYLFWKTLCNSDPTLNIIDKLRIYFLIFLRYVFGLTFAVKFLERNEKRVIAEYKILLNKLEGNEREKLEKILKDEIEHEKYWISQIKEKATAYLGFIILGLADAIVEITGVHAGFLGVTTSTIIAGIAGLVVGVSASIAMASAAYLQAKQGELANPKFSAIYTGVSYILAAVALATPYFLTHNMILAFVFSLLVALALVAYFNFYSSILFERNFAKEFLINSGLLLFTAMISFFFGEFLGQFFGIPRLFA